MKKLQNKLIILLICPNQSMLLIQENEACFQIHFPEQFSIEKPKNTTQNTLNLSFHKEIEMINLIQSTTKYNVITCDLN